MRRQLRWYGASPLHLLAMLACFGLAGYAAARLVPSAPLGIAVWFLGAVAGHDLVLMPLYTLADRSAMLALRHREPQLPAGPWINYLRVPAALSGLLLLVWFPLILRLTPNYHASTTLSADPYVWHWLAVTGALFLLSAVAFAYRLRRGSRSVPAAAEPEEAEAGAVDDDGERESPPEPQPPAIQAPDPPGPDPDPGAEPGPGPEPAPGPEQLSDQRDGVPPEADPGGAIQTRVGNE